MLLRLHNCIIELPSDSWYPIRLFLFPSPSLLAPFFSVAWWRIVVPFIVSIPLTHFRKSCCHVNSDVSYRRERSSTHQGRTQKASTRGFSVRVPRRSGNTKEEGNLFVRVVIKVEDRGDKRRREKFWRGNASRLSCNFNIQRKRRFYCYFSNFSIRQKFQLPSSSPTPVVTTHVAPSFKAGVALKSKRCRRATA